MKHYTVGCILVLFLAALTIFCFQSKWYIKNASWHPGKAVVAQLNGLGDSALQSSDIPVAALLQYKDEIMGAGYNTVRKGNAAGGHAEINAISAAMGKVGLDSFMKLDREKLTLVTTWEPCAMCRGAIVEYRINHVIVVKTKPLSFRWNDFKSTCLFEWKKQVSDIDSVQEDLFKKHPLYKYQHYKGNF